MLSSPALQTLIKKASDNLRRNIAGLTAIVSSKAEELAVQGQTIYGQQQGPFSPICGRSSNDYIGAWFDQSHMRGQGHRAQVDAATARHRRAQGARHNHWRRRASRQAAMVIC